MKKSYIKILVFIGVIIAVALIIKAYNDYNLECSKEDEICKSKKWFFKNRTTTLTTEIK